MSGLQEFNLFETNNGGDGWVLVRMMKRMASEKANKFSDSFWNGTFFDTIVTFGEVLTMKNHSYVI